ncbi:MAG: hypothetical protein BIFFINMI_03542 [Phycisphaerae bacterium]|nr:hypothetical protein [Phycisphaerae bacterium]
MQLHEYILLAFSSLFVIVDPIGLVPVFLAITPNDSERARARMAALACLVACGCLVVFALTGRLLFRFLGISMPAMEMAASIILLLIALDMLRARHSPVQQTAEDADAGAEKDDIAITPLALPMLAGPGAISTVILLQQKADGLTQALSLHLCIIAIMVLSLGILLAAARLARWMNPIVIRIVTRVMGLILAAIAFQFLLNALSGVGLIR